MLIVYHQCQLYYTLLSPFKLLFLLVIHVEEDIVIIVSLVLHVHVDNYNAAFYEDPFAKALHLKHES